MIDTGRRGEVWLVELNHKRRPVVVVNDDTMVIEIDRVVATVTSQQQRNKYDVEIKHWKDAGLDKPSIVRCSKINTLHYKELIHRIGRLMDDDLDEVLTRIRDFFTLRGNGG